MMRLDDREWKSFELYSVANVSHGRRLTKDARIQGKTPLMTAGFSSQGVAEFVSNDLIKYNNAVTVDMFCNSFYKPFSVVGDDNIYFIQSEHINRFTGAFISVCIANQSSVYNYGKQVREKVLKRFRIMLPITDDGEPDYQFMEDYIRELMAEKKKQYRGYVKKRITELCAVPDDKQVDWKSMIDSHEWEPFYMSQVFEEPQRGKRIVNENHIEGNTPLVSSQGTNNGVTNFVGNEDGVRRFINCLSIANGGSSAGKCYYQPFEFVGADHVTQCHRLDASPQQYLFLSTIVTKALMGKYGFSHEIKDKALLRERVLLPVTESGQPDYDFMELFGRKMMENKYNQYLDFLAVSDAIEP